MKAFLTGLLFLAAVAILWGLGVLLFPLLMVLAVMIRVIVIITLLILAIWLLGKFILYVWEKMK